MTDEQLISLMNPLSLKTDYVTELANRFKAKCEEVEKVREDLNRQHTGDCPDCDNSGCYATQGKDGGPEPNQCQWCYESPNSKFNQANREAELTRLRQENERLTKVNLDISSRLLFDTNRLQIQLSDAYAAIREAKTIMTDQLADSTAYREMACHIVNKMRKWINNMEVKP